MQNQTNEIHHLPLAAIIHDDDDHSVEVLLTQLAKQLKQENYRIAGLTHYQSQYPNGNKSMFLCDLASGQQYEITEDLGTESKTCSLNPQAVTQASEALRKAFDDQAQFIFINRFGALEAEGKGFAQEFAAFVSIGTPVITAVAKRHVPAWDAFSGGLYTPLAKNLEQAHAWSVQQLRP